MDKWASFNVNLLQNLLFDQYKVLFFSSYLCWYDVIVNEQTIHYYFRKEKESRWKKNEQVCSFVHFFPIFSPVFSATRTACYSVLINLFLLVSYRDLYNMQSICYTTWFTIVIYNITWLRFPNILKQSPHPRPPPPPIWKNEKSRSKLLRLSAKKDGPNARNSGPWLGKLMTSGL